MTVTPECLRRTKKSAHPVARFVADGVELALRPAYPADPGSRERDIRAFAALRELHADSFFDTARPSVDAVRDWVENRYDGDDRQINFVVCDSGGAVQLFMGLSEIDAGQRRAEFGRLMRAEAAPRGIAAAALPLLFGWCREIGLERIDLEVFADNDPARRLYERAGFRVSEAFERIPLHGDGRILWNRGGGEGGRSVLAMSLALAPPPGHEKA